MMLKRSKAALAALGLLHVLSHKKGYAWPTFKTVATQLGVSERHARRLIEELILLGLISSSRLGRGRYAYRLNHDRIAAMGIERIYWVKIRGEWTANKEQTEAITNDAVQGKEMANIRASNSDKNVKNKGQKCHKPCGGIEAQAIESKDEINETQAAEYNKIDNNEKLLSPLPPSLKNSGSVSEGGGTGPSQVDPQTGVNTATGFSLVDGEERNGSEGSGEAMTTTQEPGPESVVDLVRNRWRIRRRVRVKLHRKCDQHLREALEALDRELGREELEQWIERWLDREDDYVKQRQWAVPTFIAWVRSKVGVATAPKQARCHVRQSDVKPIQPCSPRRSTEVPYAAKRWNEVVTLGQKVETWSTLEGGNPDDPDLLANLEEVLRICQHIHRTRRSEEVAWLTFRWLLRSKDGTPNWRRVLSEGIFWAGQDIKQHEPVTPEEVQRRMEMIDRVIETYCQHKGESSAQPQKAVNEYKPVRLKAIEPEPLPPPKNRTQVDPNDPDDSWRKLHEMQKKMLLKWAEEQERWKKEVGLDRFRGGSKQRNTDHEWFGYQYVDAEGEGPDLDEPEEHGDYEEDDQEYR